VTQGFGERFSVGMLLDLGKKRNTSRQQGIKRGSKVGEGKYIYTYDPGGKERGGRKKKGKEA